MILGEGFSCVHERCQERQVAVFTTDSKPGQRALGMAAPEFLGNEKQSSIGWQLLRWHTMREAEGEVHLAGPDRFAERPLGEIHLPRLRLGEGRE